LEGKVCLDESEAPSSSSSSSESSGAVGPAQWYSRVRMVSKMFSSFLIDIFFSHSSFMSLENLLR
jgi:hypothetical protein